MTSIPLKHETVQRYMNLGEERKFNGCTEIQCIFCSEDTPGQITVEAQIPAISTPKPFTISVVVEKDGSVIHRTSCNCPVLIKCKHINKVLQRIADSPNNPISARPTRKRKAEAKRDTSVYFVIAIKKNRRCYGHSHYYEIEQSDPEILGVFFSKQAANQCAKARVGLDEESDDEAEDGKNSVDESLFEYPGEDFEEEEDDDHDDNHGKEFEKVWVECRKVEDEYRHSVATVAQVDFF